MKGIKIGIVGVCVSLVGIAFAMNTNFLLLFPFFGDILYSRNGCLRFASVDLQKSLLPLITIGDSECPFRSSRRILPEVAGGCRRFFMQKEEKTKEKRRCRCVAAKACSRMP